MIALFSNLQGASFREDTPIQELNAQIILELLDVNDPSIIRIEDSKVFIQSEKIFPTDHGVFLKTSGKELRLPHLQSSSDGCYISYSQIDSTVYPLITCKNCGKVFNPNIFNLGKCPRCGYQN